MALIGKIRKNSWLLIVLIGLGLGGFIVMDMFSGQQSVFGSQQFNVGSVDGQKLDWNHFNRTEQLLYGNSGGEVFSRRNALWNYFVEEAIVQKEADLLGLGVSKSELLDLQFGNNLSPIMTQRFQNPTTRQVDRQQLNQFKQIIEQDQINEAIQGGQLSSTFPYFWAHQEKEIIKDRLQTKINEMVGQAMYTPTWMVEMVHADQNARINFNYVQIPFDEIDNSEITLEDSDYAAFLQENKALYMQDEETRKVEYTTFNVLPTAKDTAAIRTQIEKLIPAFEKSEDDSLFVENNYGTIDAAFFTKEALSPEVADTLFSIPVGTVYGPYVDGNAFSAVKLLDRKMIPDSVRARHILLRAATQVEYIQAQQTVDSLKNLIEAGTHTFDSLALAFGSDGTRTQGGDLGYAYPGQMVKPFNDLLFFEAEEGELHPVFTEFGVHLVEVTGKKFVNNNEGVRVAYLNQSIVPSQETQDSIYESVLAFVGENRTRDQLIQSITENTELELETSAPLKMNDFFVGTLGAGQTSRDIIRWTFDGATSVNDVSPEIYIFQDPVEYHNSKYIIASLKTIQKAGLPSVEYIKEEIEPEVIKKHKGEILKGKIQGQDLAAIAASFDTQVDTATNVTFNAGFIPNLGSEPKVVATAFNLGLNQVSKPIVGSNGVYVLMPTSEPAPSTPANVAQLRRQTSSNMQAQVSGRLMETIKKNTDIEDNRFRFY